MNKLIKKKRNILRILTYHRVANENTAEFLNPRLISASPSVFEKQMKHLAKNYNVVSIQQVLDVVENQTQLPKHAVLITFDDAYIDFKEIAWPILKKYKLPATLFVPTSYPNHPERSFWWDRIYRAFKDTEKTSIEIEPVGILSLKNDEERLNNLRRVQDFLKSISHEAAMDVVDETCNRLNIADRPIKSVLDWEEIRWLCIKGITIGAHTQTHPMLNQLQTDDIRNEIKHSQEDLLREIGYTYPIFCMPGGGMNNQVQDILQENEIELGFSTLDGINDMSTADLLYLRRTNITPRTTPMVFRLRMLTPTAQIDAWRHRKINSNTVSRKPSYA